MIDAYIWPTGNGKKITIMLEECGLEYRAIPVNINKGDQFKPEFEALSPNNKMPAIVDHDAKGGQIAMFESGAILQYLGEKTGKLLPTDLHGKYYVLQWVYWQIGGLGPMAGQAHHFLRYAPEKIEYPMHRFRTEVARLYTVMDKQLGKYEYLASEYSIADIAGLALGFPLRLARTGSERLPQCETLVRNRQGSASGSQERRQRRSGVGELGAADDG